MIDEELKKQVRNYRNGFPVPTRIIGGIGPGYELCIQCLLWESLCRLVDGLSVDDALNASLKETTELGYSGAQVHCVRHCLHQIMERGYERWLPKPTHESYQLHSRRWPDCPLPPKSK